VLAHKEMGEFTPAVPPDPLDAIWLSTYAQLAHEDALWFEDLRTSENIPIEDVCVVKRATAFSSNFFCIEQRLLEREYRFYAEASKAAFLAEPPSSQMQRLSGLPVMPDVY